MAKLINVLIVDDSALIRELLADIFKRTPDIRVVGTAVDPYDAREKIKQLNPDVITLDIEMPKMNGVTFLKNLMRLRPMPVVMISTLTEAGAAITLEALEVGAVDYVAKPKLLPGETLQGYESLICDKVRHAAQANIQKHGVAEAIASEQAKQAELSALTGNIRFKLNFLVAIGASTGGTEAIKDIIQHLPANFPPVVIVQHIPAAFSASFAKRMDGRCEMKVQEAKHNMEIQHGNIYIAPGNYHLSVVRRGTSMFCSVREGQRVNGHIPSVDVLFDSVAETMGKNVVAAILTGMGNDGAKGLLNIKHMGANTIAQSKETCVVWGMPKEAVRIGAADVQVKLQDIHKYLIQAAIRKSRRTEGNDARRAGL